MKEPGEENILANNEDLWIEDISSQDNHDFEKYFKPGDKVRCIYEGWEGSYPGIGEVVEVNQNNYRLGLGIKFEGGIPVHSWPEASLELVDGQEADERRPDVLD